MMRRAFLMLMFHKSLLASLTLPLADKKHDRSNGFLRSNIRYLAESANGGGSAHPLIPVMRNTRLPLIFVQLMNRSMLLESTVWAVWRLAVPMPSHAVKATRMTITSNTIILQQMTYTLLLKYLRNVLGGFWIKRVPFGHISVQGMHILILFSSTSILLLGQALTQELWSTTKLSVTPHAERTNR